MPASHQTRELLADAPFAVLLAAAPLLLVALLGVLAGTIAPTLRSSRPGGRSGPADVETAGARRGRVLVMALGALGTLSLTVAAGQVLAL